jgi:MYXO-CTERM domain-containing protein
VSIEDLVERTYTTVEYGGNDDRGGTLVYSWQVDGAGWSSWSEELKAEVSALTQGVHTFEVKSRDRWMNEDPSPASASFTVAAQKEPAAGCGCDLDSSNGAPSGALASLLAAVMLGLTIRRRTA